MILVIIHGFYEVLLNEYVSMYSETSEFRTLLVTKMYVFLSTELPNSKTITVLIFRLISYYLDINSFDIAINNNV